MSKICTNCGNEMDDATMFCVNCGTPVSAPVAEPVAKPTPEPTPEPEKKTEKACCKLDPKKLGILAAAIVAAIAVIAIICSIAAPRLGWQSGLTNYFDLSEGKAGAVTKNIPREAYEWLEDEYDMTKKDITSDKKDYAEDISESAKEYYGDNFKVKFKVEKSKRFTKKMLERLADGIENSYDIDSKKVKAAYRADVKLDVSGKDGFSWTEDTVTVVKIGTKWYVVESFSGEGKDARATLAGLDAIICTESFMDEVAKKAD